MKNCIPHLTTTAGLALVLGLASASAQTTIYRETFGNNTPGSNIAFNNTSVSWNLLRATSNGGNLIDASSGTTDVGISSGANSASNASFSGLLNVNAGTSLSTSNGFTFISNTASFLAYTSEYTIDRSVYTPTTVTWNANRGFGASSVPNLRFAAQIAGSWYVANFSSETGNITPTDTSSPGNGGITTSSLFTANLTTATWYALTAAAGTPLSVSSTATALASGNITAFGLMGTGFNTATVRFDNLEITASAIPEPSTFAALAGLGVLILAATRRRPAV